MQEKTPAPDEKPEISPRVASSRQILRLVRLGKNFNKAVADLPNGQKYIDEQRELAELMRRQDPSQLDGLY
jgi:hypothetical protein